MTTAPRVLFIAGGRGPDYQCDMVHHGLKSLLGSSLEEIKPLWYMYDSLGQEQKAGLYGRGFTIYGRLPANELTFAPLSPVSDALTRSFGGSHRLTRRVRWRVLQQQHRAARLLRNIDRRRYDLIVFGSIHRCADYLDEVLAAYPADRVAFVDGEDHSNIRSELTGKGIYFKRELESRNVGALPINFAIPQELIVSDVPAKTKDWATVVPGDPATYVFSSEVAYYEDYQTSRYGLTMKKGGWDCLRHYEILMNGCLPYFPALNECPSATMTAFPKDVVGSISDAVLQGSISHQQYGDLVRELLDHTRSRLTTRAIGAYLLRQLDVPSTELQ